MHITQNAHFSPKTAQRIFHIQKIKLKLSIVYFRVWDENVPVYVNFLRKVFIYHQKQPTAQFGNQKVASKLPIGYLGVSDGNIHYYAIFSNFLLFTPLGQAQFSSMHP